MTVKYTEDLGIFQQRPNRATDQSRAINIAMAITEGRNLLAAYPIVVDEGLGVMDGDHRLAAAKAAGVGIWYLVVPGITVEDQARANALTKSWSFLDWATFFAARPDCANRAEYQQVLDLSAEFPRVGFANIVSFCRYGSWDRNALRASFRDGKFSITSLSAARTIAQIMTDFRERGLPGDHAVSGASVRLYGNDEYDHARMIRQMDRFPDEVKRQPTSDEYLRSFQALYNWHQRARVYLIAA